MSLELLNKDIEIWENRLKDIENCEKRGRTVCFNSLKRDDMNLCSKYKENCCTDCPVFIVRNTRHCLNSPYNIILHLMDDTTNTEWVEAFFIKDPVKKYIDFLKDVRDNYFEYKIK